MTEIEEIRRSYMPGEFKCILIAESPPDDPRRFFYFSDVKEHDHLFLAVMQTLYPQDYHEYMASRRETSMKISLLKRFQGEGFYLMDLYASSSDVHKLDDGLVAGEMIRSLSNLGASDISIIMIKANVYDTLVRPLSEAGFSRLVKIRIPFPLYQWKPSFDRLFSRALRVAALRLK